MGHPCRADRKPPEVGDSMSAMTTTQGHEMNTDQLALLKRTLATDLTDNEFALFAEVCNRLQLDPFRRHIYAIKRGGRMTIQTGIDGFRAVASRSGEYEGQAGPFWCGEDGVWRDAWLTKEPPKAAKVGVYRRGFREPVWGVARFDSYAGDNLWRKMPEIMIAKCAEALALRKAFPETLSGVYSAEEMDQASRGRAKPVQVTDDGEVLEAEQIPEAPLTDELLESVREAYLSQIAKAASLGELRQVHAALNKSQLSKGTKASLTMSCSERRRQLEDAA